MVVAWLAWCCCCCCCCGLVVDGRVGFVPRDGNSLVVFAFSLLWIIKSPIAINAAAVDLPQVGR
ncbi:hypothetical protein F4801DRAFT_570990 [Xylaria longipes]|nr:hypothetical protein F4801DRAFT_570990 [Xylaria longipes]